MIVSLIYLIAFVLISLFMTNKAYQYYNKHIVELSCREVKAEILDKQKFEENFDLSLEELEELGAVKLHYDFSESKYSIASTVYLKTAKAFLWVGIITLLICVLLMLLKM